MTGTTTHGDPELRALFAAAGRADGGLLERGGHLVAEPENPVDANAVAVHVEGARIGYLPGHLAERLQLAPGDTVACQVQLWGAADGGRLRVVGWVAVGSGDVAWPHTAGNPPPVTIGEQRDADAARVTAMVDAALAGDSPERAEQFRRGMVGGYHFLETVEPIKQLKREGRLEEALALCYGAINAAEHDREGREPAPWYTEQAAIIHRKRGEHDKELEVLQRWVRLCPAERRAGHRLTQRLAKLQDTA